VIVQNAVVHVIMIVLYVMLLKKFDQISAIELLVGY
jgi:hypothetical protein